MTCRPGLNMMKSKSQAFILCVKFQGENFDQLLMLHCLHQRNFHLAIAAQMFLEMIENSTMTAG